MMDLLKELSDCTICEEQLPCGARPIVQFSPSSKIVIVGQAPGKRVHETGIPWNDASGRKLREWLGVADHDFYNPDLFSIIPMGFCYPGKGKSGDLPPMPQCAKLWHSRLFNEFEATPLVLLVGQYAQRYYLKKTYKGNLTDTVRSYGEYLPGFFPLPHPSPRNQNWLKVNPWFSEEVLPDLKETVASAIRAHQSSPGSLYTS